MNVDSTQTVDEMKSVPDDDIQGVPKKSDTIEIILLL
jgi:hypothetical protein